MIAHRSWLITGSLGVALLASSCRSFDRPDAGAALKADGVDPGQLVGAIELSRRISGALLDPEYAGNSGFNLGQFIGVGDSYRDLLPLVGQFRSPFTSNGYQGGVPNPVNMLILHVAISNFAHAAAAALDPGQSFQAPGSTSATPARFQLDPEIAAQLKAMMDPSAGAGADADAAKDAIWQRVLGVWGFLPPAKEASEKTAWKSALSPQPGSLAENALLTALMHPYFLIEQ